MPRERIPAHLNMPGSAYGKLVLCIEGKHTACPGKQASALTDEPGEELCTCRCHRGAAVSSRERRVTEAVQGEPGHMLDGQ